MSVPEFPNPVVKCAGCGDDLSLLVPHLKISVKAEVNTLAVRQLPAEDGEIGGEEYSLGSKSGRGRIFQVHNFDCLEQYATDRAGQEPKLEAHSEDEIYVPEDNRSPEELVEAGELPGAALELQKALAGEE